MVPVCWDFLKGSSHVNSSCWESPTWAWAKPFRGLALVSGCDFLLWMVIAVLETLALWLERWYGTLPRYGRADRDQPTANHPADQVSIWARQHCQGDHSGPVLPWQLFIWGTAFGSLALWTNQLSVFSQAEVLWKSALEKMWPRKTQNMEQPRIRIPPSNSPTWGQDLEIGVLFHRRSQKATGGYKRLSFKLISHTAARAAEVNVG